MDPFIGLMALFVDTFSLLLYFGVWAVGTFGAFLLAVACSVIVIIALLVLGEVILFYFVACLFAVGMTVLDFYETGTASLEQFRCYVGALTLAYNRKTRMLAATAREAIREYVPKLS